MTAGATQQAPPPPPAERQVLRLVPAPCLRRACAIGRTARTPPPPSPYSSTHPRKGRGQRGDSEGTWGGAGEGKKKKTTKDTNTPEQGQTAGADGTCRGPGGTARGAGQGGAPGDESKRQGPTPQRTGGSRGDKSPRKTLVRYPTSEVWGPPRCPYRPHLSAGDKVGYARDRWPAARGGTGLGGWPMGLTKSTPHGTYCGSCPVRGC